MEAGIEGVVNGVASAKSRAREERRGRNGEEHDLREKEILIPYTGLVLAGAVDDAGVVHVHGEAEGVRRDVLHEAELLVEIVGPHEADLDAGDSDD
uniref:Uncharacterized protein n=1 Tax=Oryza rufipogon TaxID=4529 RepID=A0A0E0P4H6_ORYRU